MPFSMKGYLCRTRLSASSRQFGGGPVTFVRIFSSIGDCLVERPQLLQLLPPSTDEPSLFIGLVLLLCWCSLWWSRRTPSSPVVALLCGGCSGACNLRLATKMLCWAFNFSGLLLEDTYLPRDDKQFGVERRLGMEYV